MPSNKEETGQTAIRSPFVLGEDDSALLEQVARFAERANPEAARAALLFMGWILRDAHRRHEQSA